MRLAIASRDRETQFPGRADPMGIGEARATWDCFEGRSPPDNEAEWLRKMSRACASALTLPKAEFLRALQNIFGSRLLLDFMLVWCDVVENLKVYAVVGLGKG